jgi:hypothetical protein
VIVRTMSVKYAGPVFGCIAGVIPSSVNVCPSVLHPGFEV